MKDLFRIAAAVMLALLAGTAVGILAPALAVEVAVQVPATTATGSETTVVIPWGAYISDLASTIGTVAFAAIVWGFRRLPSNIVGILQTLRAEQLIQRAVDYGVNATAMATKDKTLSVDVGNVVIANALTYATQNGAPKVISWLGGPDGITQKIIARLDLEPAAMASGLAGDSAALVQGDTAVPIAAHKV